MYITNNTSRYIEIMYRTNHNLLLSVPVKPYALLQEVEIADANKERFKAAANIWEKAGKITVKEVHPDSVKEIEREAQNASDAFDAQTKEEQEQLDEIYDNISNTLANAGEELSNATETGTAVQFEVKEAAPKKKIKAKKGKSK